MHMNGRKTEKGTGRYRCSVLMPKLMSIDDGDKVINLELGRSHYKA